MSLGGPGALSGPRGGMVNPWGTLGGPCGTSESQGGRWGGPVRPHGSVQACLAALATIEQSWAFIGKAMGRLWRVLGGSRAAWDASEALGGPPRGSLRGAREIGGLKAKIHGVFVTSRGSPWGTLGSPGEGAKSYVLH